MSMSTTNSTNAGRDPVASYDLVQDANTLCERVLNGVPGERIAYWIGLLARDRDTLASSLPPARQAELNVTADAAMRLAEAGWVHLLQERISEGSCAYIVVIRERPRTLAQPVITRRRLSHADRAMALMLGGAAA